MMKYDEFVGQVQYRARLSDGGQAVRAIRATLETLNERLAGGESSDLAAQLPVEISNYLKEPVLQEKFGLKEFFERVAEREGEPVSDAAFHACAVVSVLCDAVSAGEMEDVRSQLPGEYDRLFEVAHLTVMAHGRA